MLNVDNLVAFGLLHELAEKTSQGSVPFSKVKDPAVIHEKIVYDDSCPVVVDEHKVYPIVADACIDEQHHDVVSTYDHFIAGLSVRYCVYEFSDLNFVDFSAMDEEGNSIDFVIEDGHFYISG